jgi:prephenate dehydrogenase
MRAAPDRWATQVGPLRSLHAVLEDPRARAGPVSSTVGVIGAGLIGGSIARAYLEAGAVVQVVDHDPAVAEQAASAGATVTSLAQLAGDADVVFLCPPPNDVATVWRDWLEVVPRRPDRSVVLDVASVKRPVLDGLAATGSPWATDTTVLTLSHPMAGRGRGGWQHSDPELFRDATWVMMPPEQATGQEIVRAVRAVRALGATVCFMEPGFHDHFAAVTSHIAHVLAFTFQALVDQVDPNGWRRFSGNSLRDVLRVASADHDLWTEILSGNQQELQPLLHDLAGRLERFDPATDIPLEPPRDPVPDLVGEDDAEVLCLPADGPIGGRRAELLATGRRGWHLDDIEVAAETGEVRLRFAAPVASTS